MSETWQNAIIIVSATLIVVGLTIVVPAFIRVWRRRRRARKYATGGTIVAAGGWCAPSEMLYDLADRARADWAPPVLSGEKMAATWIDEAAQPEPLPEIGKTDTDTEWVILRKWDDIWDRDVQTFVNELEAQQAYLKELAHVYDDEIVVLAQRTTIEQTVAAQHGGRGPRPEPTEEEKRAQAEEFAKNGGFPHVATRRGGIVFHTDQTDDNTHGR